MVPADELEEYPRPRFRRFFLLPVAIVAAAVALFAALRPASDSDGRPPASLPEFSLPLLDGGTLTSTDLEGAPLVLNVWASWCSPCREEAPTFERLWRRHRGHGLQIIGINTQDDEPSARAFVEEFGITYPVVRDADQALVAELEEFSGISDAWPQTFFVGTDGRFVSSDAGDALTTEDGTVLGAISERDLETRIAQLLGAAPAASP
jgi:cytochrome c biogenesis protein CcmG/thiol:disulfide interchange protein DsbE